MAQVKEKIDITSFRGKDRVLAFRKLGDDKAASLLAFQIEHKWEYERKTDSKATKDGNVVSGGGLEVKLSIEGLASNDPVNKLLADSVIEGFDLEIWDINLAGEKKDGKYPALYAQGKLNKWELPANVEDLVEISTEMAVTGRPVEGYATLTSDQEKEAMYVFQDTVAKTTSSSSTGKSQ